MCIIDMERVKIWGNSKECGYVNIAKYYTCMDKIDRAYNWMWDGCMITKVRGYVRLRLQLINYYKYLEWIGSLKWLGN